MVMPGRKFPNSSNYRYGFNGKENDNEVKGDGNQQDYGMRIFDTRLGRFLSVDPLTRDYPMLSTYSYAENQPIWAIDLDGLEKQIVINKHINNKLREVRLQTTYDAKNKQYVDMQFKYINGGRVTTQDVLVINQYYDKDGRFIRDDFSCADQLDKEQNKLLSKSKMKPLPEGVITDYTIAGHPEIQPSSFLSDGLSEVDITKKIPLITNLSHTFSSSAFYTAHPGSGEGTLISKDVAIAIDKNIKAFYDLPAIVKEDGGIKSINITLSYFVNSNVNDKEFANLQNAFNQVANQVKEIYLKSGVKNVNVNPIVERRPDSSEANKTTPDIQIKLQR